MNSYDMTMIFLASLDDDALEEAIGRVTGEVERFGGTLSNINRVGKRQFARTMQKKDNGFYVKAELTLDPAQVSALQARLKLLPGLFRVQIIRVDERAPAPAETEPVAEPVAEEAPAETAEAK